jgi:hypothetical protein
MRLPVAFLLFANVALYSCKKLGEIKFDKHLWTKTDPGFPPTERMKMVDDLTKNYKLTGIRYTELRQLLGEYDFKDSASVGYQLVIDYGHDIDPVYSKDLTFELTKDSVVKTWKIIEWKK